MIENACVRERFFMAARKWPDCLGFPCRFPLRTKYIPVCFCSQSSWHRFQRLVREPYGLCLDQETVACPSRAKANVQRNEQAPSPLVVNIKSIGQAGQFLLALSVRRKLFGYTVWILDFVYLLSQVRLLMDIRDQLGLIFTQH